MDIEQFLQHEPTEKEHLDFVSRALNSGESILADAHGKYDDFTLMQSSSNDDFWLVRPERRNSYDNLIARCNDWLSLIEYAAKEIGCSHLVQEVFISPYENIGALEKLQRYIDAIDKTIKQLRPVVNKLQEQKLLQQQNEIKEELGTAHPRFKKNYLYIGKYKIRFQKRSLNWYMLEAVFANKATEDGANASDIFALENPKEYITREAHEKEKHKYLETRRRINNRVTKVTGINDELILVDRANYTINKEFGS